MEKSVERSFKKGSTGEVAMTKGAKTTREPERTESRCDHSPPTTKGKFRISLPLPHSPHTQTHTEFKCSTNLR